MTRRCTATSTPAAARLSTAYGDSSRHSSTLTLTHHSSYLVHSSKCFEPTQYGRKWRARPSGQRARERRKNVEAIFISGVKNMILLCSSQ
ncbi:unnamed protein product [Laminaria digitata]